MIDLKACLSTSEESTTIFGSPRARFENRLLREAIVEANRLIHALRNGTRSASALERLALHILIAQYEHQTGRCAHDEATAALTKKARRILGGRRGREQTLPASREAATSNEDPQQDRP